MAQYRLNSYDADVWIPEFKGLMQYGDQMGTDLRYSPDCMNVETPGGVLQPAPAFIGPEIEVADNASYLENAGNAGTIMYLNALYPRYGGIVANEEGNGSSSSSSEVPSLPYPWRYVENNIYIFILNNHVFRGVDTSPFPVYSPSSMPNPRAVTIEAVPFAEGVTITSVPNTGWSWCTYQDKLSSSVTITQETSLGPTSVTIDANTVTTTLLFSHPSVGMFQYNHLTGEITKITTPAQFAYIARYAERIWGVGARVDQKDRIFYSKPYSLSDWTADTANPANGGGEIQEPTFDDDKFTGLYPFGDSLIAFMQKRAWKISGSDPSNFMIQEQLGNGTKYPDTIAVFDDRIIMLGDEGFVSYDGSQVSPFAQQMTHEIMRENNSKPRATKILSKYVFTDGVLSEGNQSGYKLLVYDTKDGTFTQMDSPIILSFAKTMPCMLTFDETAVENSTSYDSHFYFVPISFDSWHNQQISTKATKWVSPWVTLGRKDIKKGGFDFYFTPEIEKKVSHEIIHTDYDRVVKVYVAGPVTFTFTIQTETKKKSKTYTVQPLTDEQVAAGKQYKQKRLHFGGSGRRFRVIIETAAGNTIPWRLVGGIHIIAEIDKD